MRKSVLVVTHRRGFEADPVIDELRKRGIEVFRFNTDCGDKVSALSFYPENSSAHFMCDKKEIASEDIAVGWCQQLPPYLAQMRNRQETLQQESLLALQLATFGCMQIPWLNNPCHVLHASNKIRQLVTARSVGLKTPRTLVSNHPSDIRKFAASGDIVAKNIATPWITQAGNQTLAAYTKLVKNQWLADDSGLRFSPVIYQEYHARRRDIRVVVVDNKVFPASCVPTQYQKEDIRRGKGTGESYRKCRFDAAATKKLVRMMHRLKINYCAADFLEDKQGNLLFLEINTCGSWWWVDKLYGGKICLAIADALQSRIRAAS